MSVARIKHTLVQEIGRVRAGLGVEALQQIVPDVARRTLQRYLAELVAEGRLIPIGRARARVYRSGSPVYSGVAEPGPSQPGPTEPLIALSLEGEEIRALVRQPIARRSPVGYQRDFLTRYLPNTTAYLPEALRRRLHDIGHAPVSDPHAGTYARQILDRLLIDLSWASSHLEGNTYSRLDTQNLIEFGREAEGKDVLETQMILNHKAAIEMLVEQADQISFNRYTIQNLHALLAENLLPDSAACGRIRRIEVGIRDSVFHPLGIPQQIEEHFDLLLAKATAIEDPFEQAFFVMVHMPHLQPFEDVNKRVSRLAANIPMIRHNLAPLSFVDVPRAQYIEGTLGVYELNRIELLRDVFVWAYERSCRRYTILRDVLPEPDPLRLKHRDLLRTTIQALVLEGARRDDTDRIRQRVQAHVAASELNAVIALVSNELHQLHEGSIARFRLSPSQFRPWLAAQGADRSR